MSHPDAEVLADIALGATVDRQAADHVAGCSHCANELGTLRRTIELTREGASAGVQMTRPPADLWVRIEAALEAPVDIRALDHALDPALDRAGDPAGGSVPPARVRRLEATRDKRARRRRRVPAAWLAGAAAAAALAGLLTGRAVWAGPAASDPPAVAQAGLATLDTSEVIGAARVVRDGGRLDLTLDLATPSVPAPGEGYLEVWLINKDGRRMVAVGVLGTGSGDASSPRATFPIAQNLLDAGYVVVDVSREALDDDPRHSGDSLARGTLTVT